MRIGVQRLQWRKVSRQARDDQLKETFGTCQVLEVVLSQVAQSDIIRQVVFHEIGGCLGEKYLPTVPGAHDASSTMQIQANVAFMCQCWFTSMQSHADTHCSAFWPGMGRKCALHIHRC